MKVVGIAFLSAVLAAGCALQTGQDGDPTTQDPQHPDEIVGLGTATSRPLAVDTNGTEMGGLQPVSPVSAPAAPPSRAPHPDTSPGTASGSSSGSQAGSGSGSSPDQPNPSPWYQATQGGASSSGLGSTGEKASGGE